MFTLESYWKRRALEFRLIINFDGLVLTFLPSLQTRLINLSHIEVNNEIGSKSSVPNGV